MEIWIYETSSLRKWNYKNLRILVVLAKSLMHFFSSDLSQSLGGGHYHSSCARLLHGLPGIRCMFGAFTGGELWYCYELSPSMISNIRRLAFDMVILNVFHGDKITNALRWLISTFWEFWSSTRSGPTASLQTHLWRGWFCCCSPPTNAAKKIKPATGRGKVFQRAVRLLHGGEKGVEQAVEGGWGERGIWMWFNM